MPRPGQAHARRRLQASRDDSSGEDEPGDGSGTYKGSQVLPVAQIAEDFDGEILDGATFLAVANRDNAKFPSWTRAPNPYLSTLDGEAMIIEQDEVIIAVSTQDSTIEGEPRAGPSRHPALAKGSWEVLYPIHFDNYKKDLDRRWPPDPPLPYPADCPRKPNVYDPKDTMYFMNGYPRRRMQTGDDDERSIPVLEATDNTANNDVADDPQEPGLNEEEQMNAVSTLAPAVPTNTKKRKSALDDQTNRDEQVESVKKKTYGPETLGPRHEPREPLVSIVQRFSTTEILSILEIISTQLSGTIDTLSTLLQMPKQYTLPTLTLPTQPDTSASISDSTSTPPSFPDSDDAVPIDGRSTPNPFPTLHARWVFALLLVLPRQISSGEISVLRELARTIMRVAGWRFVRAVTEGEIGEDFRLGQRRKMAKEKELLLDEDKEESSVDETLARCWIVVYSIAVGWGQYDLLDDLRGIFA